MDQLAVGEPRLHSAASCDMGYFPLRDQRSKMTAVLKIAGKLYLIQAAIGFAAGFFIPWVKIFHAAGY